MINKTDLISFLRKETATTLKVMRAFPEEQGSFTPHERSQDALRLMKTFVFELWLMKANVLGETIAPDAYETYAPATIPDVIADFEKEADATISALEGMTDAQLAETVEFGGMRFPKDQFAHMMYCDQIHHRGQLSVYVRMAGGKVPSIYGPSADDAGLNL